MLPHPCVQTTTDSPVDFCKSTETKIFTLVQEASMGNVCASKFLKVQLAKRTK